MFVWSKLSSEKWADAWEERFVGAADQSTVITRIPGRKTIRVEVYCEKRREAEAIKKQFGGSVREIKSQNWAASSAEPPPPVKVRNSLLVCGEKDKDKIAALAEAHPSRTVISIPADMAFGTGHHETTSTVLRLLVDYAGSKKGQPWSMLDLGTGSGLLAIAAEKLGATDIWGCDFDPLAVKVAKGNLKRNKTKVVALDEADVLKWKPTRRWDCVAANIFADVLEAIFPKIVRALQKDGVVFLSGILHSQSEACLAAGRKAGLTFDLVHRKGKWVTARGKHA